MSFRFNISSSEYLDDYGNLYYNLEQFSLLPLYTLANTTTAVYSHPCINKNDFSTVCSFQDIILSTGLYSPAFIMNGVKFTNEN